LLDPFSEHAILRANSLDDSGNIYRINKGLYRINAALESSLNVPEKLPIYYDRDFIYTQINTIQKKSVLSNLEVRFTKESTEIPCYIFSQFVFKGHLLKGSSAVDNPWLVCVDDYTQPNDLYDTFYENFNRIWDESKSSLEKLTRISSSRIENNTIFISHGQNDFYREINNYLVNEYKLPTVYDERDFLKGNTYIENIEMLVNDSSYGLVVLTKDDEFEKEKWRARQNVIHELGIFQNAFGRTNTLVLKEEGVDFPTNLNGMNEYQINLNNHADIYNKIGSWLRQRGIP